MTATILDGAKTAESILAGVREEAARLRDQIQSARARAAESRQKESP